MQPSSASVGQGLVCIAQRPHVCVRALHRHWLSPRTLWNFQTSSDHASRTLPASTTHMPSSNKAREACDLDGTAPSPSIPKYRAEPQTLVQIQHRFPVRLSFISNPGKDSIAARPTGRGGARISGQLWGNIWAEYICARSDPPPAHLHACVCVCVSGAAAKHGAGGVRRGLRCLCRGDARPCLQLWAWRNSAV